nr:PREDICTED: coronin-7-like [Apteryx mantelli mantelli]
MARCEEPVALALHSGPGKQGVAFPHSISHQGVKRVPGKRGLPEAGPRGRRWSETGRKAWIGDVRAGSVASCGNHVKASCRWIAFNADSAGVLGIVPLECWDGDKRTVSQLCCHSDVVTDFDFSPFDQLLLATGSADETVKVWRLPESGQDMPPGAGLTLGPVGCPVDVLQFHPTADGVLASGAGKRATVWDVGRQQSLTDLDSHGDQLQSLSWKQDGRLLGTSCKDKKLRIFDPRARISGHVACPPEWDPCPPAGPASSPRFIGLLLLGRMAAVRALLSSAPSAPRRSPTAASCLRAAFPSPADSEGSSVAASSWALCCRAGAERKGFSDKDLPRVRSGQLDPHSSANNSD